MRGTCNTVRELNTNFWSENLGVPGHMRGLEVMSD
jgi:hypothetical protein